MSVEVIDKENLKTELEQVFKEESLAMLCKNFGLTLSDSGALECDRQLSFNELMEVNYVVNRANGFADHKDMPVVALALAATEIMECCDADSHGDEVEEQADFIIRLMDLWRCMSDEPLVNPDYKFRGHARKKLAFVPDALKAHNAVSRLVQYDRKGRKLEFVTALRTLIVQYTNATLLKTIQAKIFFNASRPILHGAKY